MKKKKKDITEHDYDMRGTEGRKYHREKKTKEKGLQRWERMYVLGKWSPLMS